MEPLERLGALAIEEGVPISLAVWPWTKLTSRYTISIVYLIQIISYLVSTMNASLSVINM
jgi:hypothetical protein